MISQRSEVMGGVPCIDGTRIPVKTIIDALADGLSVQQVVAEFPQLSMDDVYDALRYVGQLI